MKVKSITLFYAALLLTASTYGQTQINYYPDSAWQIKKPSELKMNAAKLDSAVNFALANDSKTDYNLSVANLKSYVREPGYKILGPMKDRGKPAGLIIRKGYIVAQWGDLNRVDMTFSAAKSYLATVAGLAFDSRLIKSVDDRVSQYVTDETFESTHNSKITWRHLLTQSSDWSGCMFGICDWADRPPKEGGTDEWRSRPLLEPGTAYEYNDVRVNTLAYSLLQVFRKPLPQVFRERVMDPIGASTTWRWYGYENSFVNVDGVMVQSISGGGHFGGGMFINTFDHARFGLLMQRKGKWKNAQLISEAWINAAKQPSAANKDYGFLWWLNQDKQMTPLAKDLYAAQGFGGNFVVVDNDHDLVIVARWLEPSKLTEFLNLVIRSVE
ncbi:MAG: class C beta-lactamase-related serine hydrolase [Chitinophagaceae bacterium]|nr:MAG: class C beta-lactamase-related serine hydrolase [Chitinophagaceae bacterium]